ncbi:MAG: magnesium transporter [Candidatus Izemoplasmatales bacterium]
MSLENLEVENYENEILLLFHSDLPLELKKEKLDDFHDYDLSQTLLHLDASDQQEFISLFSAVQLANIISIIDAEEIVPILLTISKRVIAEVFDEMQPDDIVDILKEMSPTDQTTYLSLIHPGKRPNIKELIRFDDDVVGSFMNTSYVEIKKTDTVKQAIKKVVDQAPNVEYIVNVYVTELGYLEGVVSLKELISSGNQPTLTIEEIMATNIVALTPSAKNEEAIEMMKNYDFLLLPIVDNDFKMLGIVSFDDMTEALNKESDTDYSRLAGVTDINIDEEKETILSTIKKRMPWLVILLFVNLITSSIVSGFEGVLTQIPTLALFMPLILNMAGNTGTQSLGVIIRLFATNQLDTKRSVAKHLIKELLTGVVNGIVIAIGLFGLVIVLKLLDHQTFEQILPFASVIALSIAIALVVATLAGALVPLVMNLFKVDPAVASGPFITTINDIISLLIYFGLASILLSQWL